jgi:hypothetical protein
VGYFCHAALGNLQANPTNKCEGFCGKLGEVVSEFRVRKRGYSAVIDNSYQQVNKKAGEMG